jgi:hypothetical protein
LDQDQATEDEIAYFTRLILWEPALQTALKQFFNARAQSSKEAEKKLCAFALKIWFPLCRVRFLVVLA